MQRTYRASAPATVVAALAVGAGTQAVSAAPVPTTVEPLVRMAADEIVACGMTFDATRGALRVRAAYYLEKSPGGPQFVLRAAVSSAEHQPSAISAAFLATREATTESLLPPVERRPDGSAETRAALPGFEGADFVRSLMIGGGRLVVRLLDETTIESDIEGPLSQQVRASYLNCAGDLERP